MQLCSTCFAPTVEDPCRICRDLTRDCSTLCMVEDFNDLLAIEATGTYSGRYHMLHGALNPMNGVGPDQLRFREFLVRAQQSEVRQVILAMKANTNGDATARYTVHTLEPLGIPTRRRH